MASGAHTASGRAVASHGDLQLVVPECEHGIGRVIGNPADPRELASAVAFYVDEKRRDRARTVTRSWMEAYKPSRNVEETLAVYYEVVRASTK